MDNISNDGVEKLDRIKSRLTETITTPKGTKISVLFDFADRGQGVTPEIKQEATKLFATSYDYLSALVGKEDLGNEFGIQFGKAFLAQGAQIILDTSELEKSVNSGPNTYIQDLNLSTVIHEMAHQFGDEEALPMLVEMAYMMEKGYGGRIQEIQGMLLNGDLPERHISGLKDICKWLQVNNPTRLLDDILGGQISPQTLKELFKSKVEEGL